jgi:hypothetical protein
MLFETDVTEVKMGIEEMARPRRRVYKPELKRRTGWGDTWIRQLEKNGKIPEGRTDPGGKRKFWFDDEADAIVSGCAAPANPRTAA